MIVLNEQNKTHLVRLTPDQVTMAMLRPATNANPLTGAIGDLTGIPVLREPDYQGRIHTVTVFRSGDVHIKHGNDLRAFGQAGNQPCASQLGSGGDMVCPLACALDDGRVSIEDLTPGKYEVTYATWWDDDCEDVIVKWIGGPPLSLSALTNMQGHATLYGLGGLRGA